MDKMKRVFSFVLVLAMLVGSFSSFSTVAFAEETKVEAKDGDVKVEVKVEKEEAKEEVKTETKADDTKVLNNVPKDVIGTDYEAAVTRLVAFGVIGGYPDGTYKPEEEINRAQFAKIVVMALGLNDAVPAAANKSTGFSDVQPGYWAAGYINVATGQGLLKGYPDGTFRPAKKVSYAETLTMLVRALGYQDEFLPGNWPGNYVAKAAEAGITAGVQMPGDAKTGAKRGPVAQMVNNAFDAKVVKVDKYKPNTKEVEYYETNITLLKDKLEISKYENTRVVADKIVDDGLAKDEMRVRFLEEVNKYGKGDYNRGEVVKRDYKSGEEDTYRYNDFVIPRAIIGEEVTTYINDNDKAIYVERENDDKAHFDYVESLKDGKALELVAFDKDYKFEDKDSDGNRRTDYATINVFDSKDKKYRTVDAEDLNKDTKAMDELVGRMGKFVVKNNKIVYAEIMDPAEAENYAVVLENKDGQITAVHDRTNEFKKDLREDKDYDYSLVYDINGNPVELKNIEKGNVLYIQEQKYDGDEIANVAVVQNNELKGELGKVKADKVEIAGKEIKVVKYTKEKEDQKFVTSYAVNDTDEVRKWNFDSEWEDDMEDAYKETIVAYKDAVGRIAFLTTDGGNSGYKFGIITRTYGDSDRIRIFTTIDGKEGKDQIFKADKEKDIETPRLLEENTGKEQENKDSYRTVSKAGMAVKFRLNSDGEISKDKFFVMPTENVYAMTDDFGKDVIKAVQVEADKFYDESARFDKEKGKTFAVNSESVIAIDAPKVGIKGFVKGNIDGENMGFDKNVDIDDFSITTWKDIKGDKQDDKVRFYVFPKTNEEEVDGLVFIGKDGASTGSDEEAMYVLSQWKTGSKLYVEYVKYPENTKIEKEVDETDRLTDNKIIKERAYVGKEKSNGKVALTREDSKAEDFDIYENKTVKSVDGNFITLEGVSGRFSTINAVVYDEDKSKTASYIKKDMKIDVISDGVRARVIGVRDNNGATGNETSKEGTVTYINPNKTGFAVDGELVTLTEAMVLKENGNVIASGSDIATNLTVNDQVTIDGNVITRINTAADRNAAEAVDTQIAALSIADETAPTAAERLAITNARAAYTGLTAAQKALVTKLGALETLEAVITVVDGPAVAEAAAVKAVKDAVAENDKAKFIAALKNVLFTKYVAVNDDAYWTAKAAISARATTALMDAELVIVNNAEAAAAVYNAVKTAATSGTKTEFITALKNSAFAASYKVANDDAYWTAKASFNAVASVANVITALDNVNTAQEALASFTPVTLTQTGGVAGGDVQYANAAAVIAALPTQIEVTLVNGNKVMVPVTWTNTGTAYDAATAATYTFGAAWGTIPAGANNSASLAVPTVSVVVAP